jgi:hypothetical protein
MTWFRKVKAGLVKNDIEEFVGEEGNLFFNVETGELRLSDGITPGGISVGGSGGSYTLPTASATVKGGIKIDGTSITIANQVISVGTVPYNNLSGAPALSTVATSGSYTDLTNTPTTDKTVTLYQDGILEPTVGTVRWYNPSAITVSKITARLAESADDAVTVRIKKNGVSVQIVTFPANNSKQVVLTNIEMALDDYLTVDVLTVGNSIPGNGLSLEFTYNFE